MGVVEDIGRFIAYALLLYMAFGVVTTKLVASSQRAYVREQHKLVFTLGFAVAAVWSLGIFVAMWPITGAMSVPLLVWRRSYPSLRSRPTWSCRSSCE